MNELTRASLGAMTPEMTESLKAFRNRVGELPGQMDLRIENHLHAGVYSRTVFIPKGVLAFGTQIKVPTQLVISGHVVINDGLERRTYRGYHVLDGAAGRIQVAYAVEDSYVTMLFATDAKTVREAEDEFTDEAALLQTRKGDDICPE